MKIDDIMNEILYGGKGGVIFHSGDCIIDARIDVKQLQDNIDMMAKKMHMHVEREAILLKEKYEILKHDKIQCNDLLQYL